MPESHFAKNILRGKSGAELLSNLIAFVFDECHVVADGWGEFRPCYKYIWKLRESIPNVPIVGLSATLTQHQLEDFAHQARSENPRVIRQSIRRKNLKMWVAEIQRADFEDLKVLIPNDISEPADIPVTLVFVDCTRTVNRIAQWFRTLLPEAFDKEQTVRAYSSPLDEGSKNRTMDGILDGTVRLVTCTDALGMGVDLQNVDRVCQWKLNSDISLGTIIQRIGRGGRNPDPATVGLALICVTKTNRLGRNSVPIESNIRSRAITSAEANFTMPVNTDTLETVKGLIPIMTAPPANTAAGSKSKRAESRLQPAVFWQISTTGCRVNQCMAAFSDPDPLGESIDATNVGLLDCDNCMVSELLKNGHDGEEPPAVHGIPLSITRVYQEKFKTPPYTKPPKGRSKGKRCVLVHEEQKEALAKDIRTWRDTALPGLIRKRYALIRARHVLRDKEIAAIVKDISYIDGVDKLMLILQLSGMSFPGSILTPHLAELLVFIQESLTRSLPLIPEVNKDRPVAILPKPASLPSAQPSPTTQTTSVPDSDISNINAQARPFVPPIEIQLPQLPKPYARPVATFIPVPLLTLPALPKPRPWGTDLSVPQKRRTICDDRVPVHHSNGEAIDGQAPVSFEGASGVDADVAAELPNKRRRIPSRLDSVQAVLMIEKLR